MPRKGRDLPLGARILDRGLFDGEKPETYKKKQSNARQGEAIDPCLTLPRSAPLSLYFFAVLSAGGGAGGLSLFHMSSTTFQVGPILCQ